MSTIIIEFILEQNLHCDDDDDDQLSMSPSACRSIRLNEVNKPYTFYDGIQFNRRIEFPAGMEERNFFL